MGGTSSRIPPALRHVIRALVVALVGGALAALGASRLAAEPVATSRVAVSDEVGWPFYTAARDRLLETALAGDVRGAVRNDVGADDANVELSAQPTGGEISVDLTARAADAATATEAANRYAEEVVEQGELEARADAEQRLQRLRGELVDIDARIADNEAELLAAGEALDGLGEAPAEGPRLVLQSQIRRIESALDEDARRRAQIVQDLPEAREAIDAAESDYQFVRAARTSDGDLLSDATTMGLLAGIPLFLLGLGASVLWDQTLGLVRRPHDVRWATDAPVFTIDHRDGQVVDASPLQRRMIRQQIPGSAWMVVPVGRSPELAALSSSLAETVGGGRSSSDERATTERDPSETTWGAERTPRETSAATLTEGQTARLPNDTPTTSLPPPSTTTVSISDAGPGAAVSGAVVAVAGRGVRLPRLRRAIRDLELEGVPVEGVVLFEPER